jgi:hypothetical protein
MGNLRSYLLITFSSKEELAGIATSFLVLFQTKLMLILIFVLVLILLYTCSKHKIFGKHLVCDIIMPLS